MTDGGIDVCRQPRTPHVNEQLSHSQKCINVRFAVWTFYLVKLICTLFIAV